MEQMLLKSVIDIVEHIKQSPIYKDAAYLALIEREKIDRILPQLEHLVAVAIKGQCQEWGMMYCPFCERNTPMASLGIKTFDSNMDRIEVEDGFKCAYCEKVFKVDLAACLKNRERKAK